MRASRSPLLFFCAALVPCACASTEARTAPPAAPAPRETAAPPELPAPPDLPAPAAPSAPVAPVAPATPVAAEPTGGWQTLRSNGGRYTVAVRPPAGGWQRGTPLALDVRASTAAEPAVLLTDVALLLDADMPEHLHGLNRVPRVERRADGTFRVEGLYLHMPGWWEIYFDVRQGAWTERAQLRVDIE